MGFLETAIAFAKRACGNLTSSDLSDADALAVFVPQALLEFSKLAPRRGYHNLALAAGVETYALPDSNIMSVLDWSEPDAATVSPLGSGYNLAFGWQYRPAGGLQSMETISYALEAAQRYIINNIMLVGGQLEVLPTPSTSRTVRLRTTDAWALTVVEGEGEEPDTVALELPATYQMAFKLLLTAEFADEFAAELARCNNISVGSSRITIEWRNLVDLAQTSRARARQYLPSGGCGLMQG